MSPSKKEINELYSKRRYILIDKETNTPLSFTDSPMYKGHSFYINSPNTKYNRVAVFDEPFCLKDLSKNIKENKYFFIDDFLFKKSKYKNYKDFTKGKNKVVWKRLPKEVAINKIYEKTFETRINKTKYVFTLVDLEKL